MTLFKLAKKNVKQSIKDYIIYFATLVFAVAIFYIFNAIDSSNAMYTVSQREILKFAVDVMGYLSVFVCLIFAFLIVYAGNFLIKRRKKEFGIYLTLGMSKKDISKLIIIENIIIGFISLLVGIIIGIFGAQLMSIITSLMFEADLNKYTFSFSFDAMIKSVMYFGIIYLFELIFITFTVNKYQLIDLITASKKNEEIKTKNPILSVIIFILAIITLGSAYYIVCYMDFNILIKNTNYIFVAIILGIIGTFLFFYSLSGFILKLVQSIKPLYYRNINMFVLRQLNARINTMVVSMSFICILLFLTICILSSSISMNTYMTSEIKNAVRSDYYVSTMNPDKSILDEYKNNGFDITSISNDYTEITTYNSDSFIIYDSLEGIINNFQDNKDINNCEDLMSEYSTVELNYKAANPLTLSNSETFISISDYNKMAKIYGFNTEKLKDDEYIIFANYPEAMSIRNAALEKQSTFIIENVELHNKYQKVQDGFLQVAGGSYDMGFYVVSDNMINKIKANSSIYNNHAMGHYISHDEKKVNQYDQKFYDNIPYNFSYVATKTDLYLSSVGTGAIMTFIGLYLGIVFLITSAAILALREVSETSDNIERYTILYNIGTSKKMINKSLFIQIGIFFISPLLIAIFHSYFGMTFVTRIFSSFTKTYMLDGVAFTALVIILTYGVYFIITYLMSKRLINQKVQR